MSSISMNDFVTFNPSSASQTPPIHYTPNSAIPQYNGVGLPNAFVGIGGMNGVQQINGVLAGPGYVSGIYGQAQIGLPSSHANGAGPDDVSMNASF